MTLAVSAGTTYYSRQRGWDVTRSVVEDAVTLSGEILGQREMIRLKITTNDQRAFAHDIDKAITEQRLAEVGPEFRMAYRLATAGKYENLDPYGRPA